MASRSYGFKGTLSPFDSVHSLSPSSDMAAAGVALTVGFQYCPLGFAGSNLSSIASADSLARLQALAL